MTEPRVHPERKPDDAALVDALRARDADAFEKLVRTHGGRLLAVARRFLGSDQDAQDAVQDALVSALRSIDRFEGSARLSTWLHRIVVNAALMKLRSRRRRREEPIDALLPEFLEDGHHAHVPTPWRADLELERQETRTLVRRCIDRLPEGYRTVLLLRDIEGLDTETTAEQLDLSVGAVKTRLHRARQALRTLLDPHLREAVT